MTATEHYYRTEARRVLAGCATREDADELYPWEGEGDTDMARKIYDAEAERLLGGSSMSDKSKRGRIRAAVEPYDSEAIMAYRNAMGWTTKRFAELVGVSPDTMRQILRGEYAGAAAIERCHKVMAGNDAAAVNYTTPEQMLEVVGGLLKRGPVEITMTFRVGA